MSDLQRTFAKAKLASLPALPPESFEEEEDETDEMPELAPGGDPDDSSSASSASSTGTIRPLPAHNLFARPKGSSKPGKRSLDQLPWTSCFAQELYLESSSGSEDAVHHVYVTPPTATGPLFVTHHGAGSSGLSFAIFASEVRKLLPDAGVLSLDARGHGGTVITSRIPAERNEGSEHRKPLDLSLETLSGDLIRSLGLTRSKLGWSEYPDLIFVGHSLGGAVVTDVAKKGVLGDRILGYAVLDVVEGSAMDALQSMQTYLSTRPSGFPSIAAGIDWHLRSRTIRNTTSARTSVPALLQQTLAPESPSNSWIWRTDLASTQPFWEDWFTGLSKKFLEAKGGKLLLLAGTDRLDKELMIGQMQGKYQLQVFPEAGHFIHEDMPEKTATILVDFFRRNDRSALVLPPKVGDLLKAQQQKQA
ncbi:MAG: Protein phosphatase methylesterase 1 [Sclerophora amabilis]|nr:MAG: Protein phosphatase methylesterase 1 [Sclerophora amabilis]